MVLSGIISPLPLFRRFADDSILETRDISVLKLEHMRDKVKVKWVNCAKTVISPFVPAKNSERNVISSTVCVPAKTGPGGT